MSFSDMNLVATHLMADLLPFAPLVHVARALIARRITHNCVPMHCETVMAFLATVALLSMFAQPKIVSLKFRKELTK
jgi:hypothetical protein